MKILSCPYLGNAGTLVGKHTFVSKPKVPWYAGSCMKFVALVYANLKVLYMCYMTGQNFTKILWGTDGNVALSVRVKLLLSSSSPLIHVPVLMSLSGARILNDLHLMTLGFWNKAKCVCVSSIVQKTCWDLFGDFHFCAIKSNKGVIIFFSYCPRIQFCSIKFMSDILILTHLQLGLWLLLSA